MIEEELFEMMKINSNEVESIIKEQEEMEIASQHHSRDIDQSLSHSSETESEDEPNTTQGSARAANQLQDQS